MENSRLKRDRGAELAWCDLGDARRTWCARSGCDLYHKI